MTTTTTRAGEGVDPDLSAVVAAWPGLLPAIRAGIAAMVAAAATRTPSKEP